MKKVIRVDLAQTFTWETKEGFLEGEAVATRIGTFKYYDEKGNPYIELRHPKDVFDTSSIYSMRMIPITNDHPRELVTVDNAKQLQVGYVGENIIIDGENVRVPFVITDKKTIDDIKNGKNQLSLGYEAEIIDEIGMWENIQYDSRQTNIRYNHLAVVDAARAGDIAKIHLDGSKSVRLDSIVSGNKIEKPGHKVDNQTTEKEIRMATIKVDSIGYDNQAPEVAQYVTKLEDSVKALQAKIDTADAELKVKSDSISALTAERDDAKEKLEDELKKDRTEEVNKAVADRMAVLAVASKVVENFDAASKSILDMKKEVVLAKFPEAKLDGKDEVYITARFDAVAESIGNSAIASQRAASAPVIHGDAADARQAMINRRRGIKE